MIECILVFFSREIFSLYLEGYKNLQNNDLDKTKTYDGAQFAARIMTKHPVYVNLTRVNAGIIKFLLQKEDQKSSIFRFRF